MFLEDKGDRIVDEEEVFLMFLDLATRLVSTLGLKAAIQMCVMAWMAARMKKKTGLPSQSLSGRDRDPGGRGLTGEEREVPDVPF